MPEDDKDPIIPILDWRKNPVVPALEELGIITPNAIAQDTKLIRDECRGIIGKKRIKRADKFKAMNELGKVDDRIIAVAGLKPNEKVEHSGTLTLEQAVKELESEDD